MKTAVIVVFSVLLFLFAVFFICSFVFFKMAAGREKREFKISDGMIEKRGLVSEKEEIYINLSKWDSISKEDVYITSFDGVKLHGSYCVFKEAPATIILFHGWRSFGEFDFSLIIGKYIDAGFNILLVDERAHGKSGGKYITFGISESIDAAEWTKFISSREKGARPVFIDGMSMGATTVLMSVSRDISSDVKGIIADCGFTSPKEIISHVIRGYHLPAAVIFPFVSLYFKIFAHVDIGELSTVEAMRKCQIPVLFIHGEADKFVPCEMGRRAYDACVSKKSIITVPGAGHGKSYVVDRDTCLNAMHDFYLPFFQER